MKLPEFKTWNIKMKNREDFNRVTDWKELEDFDIVDIGYSDMILVFDNEENRDDVGGMILWNHMEIEEYDN